MTGAWSEEGAAPPAPPQPEEQPACEPSRAQARLPCYLILTEHGAA